MLAAVSSPCRTKAHPGSLDSLAVQFGDIMVSVDMGATLLPLLALPKPSRRKARCHSGGSLGGIGDGAAGPAKPQGAARVMSVLPSLPCKVGSWTARHAIGMSHRVAAQHNGHWHAPPGRSAHVGVTPPG